MPKQEAQQEKPARDVTKRPQLPPAFQDRVNQVKERAKNRMFFKFEEGDTAVIELVNRKENVPTKVGPGTLWLARYLSGNLHGGQGAGAPEQEGQMFQFWEHTVLRNQLDENNAGPGDVIVVVCLGPEEGEAFTYYNYYVEKIMPENAPDPATLLEGGKPSIPAKTG